MSGSGIDFGAEDPQPENYDLPTYIPPPIEGYRALSQQEVDLINEGRHIASLCQLYTHKLRTTPNIDSRWLHIGITDLQKGFMALTRSIARSSSF